MGPWGGPGAGECPPPHGSHRGAQAAPTQPLGRVLGPASPSGLDRLPDSQTRLGGRIRAPPPPERGLREGGGPHGTLVHPKCRGRGTQNGVEGECRAVTGREAGPGAGGGPVLVRAPRGAALRPHSPPWTAKGGTSVP